MQLHIVRFLRATVNRKKMAADRFGNVARMFYNSTGGPLWRSHFHCYTFKLLLKAAKVPDIRFCDLRHTFASLLLATSVHLKMVQEHLGHSQISITLDIYSHVLPMIGIEATDKLDSVLWPKHASPKTAVSTG